MFNFILKLNKIIIILFLFSCFTCSHSSCFAYSHSVFNINKKILNKTNDNTPIGTIITWPFKNFNPNPKLWTECGQGKANHKNSMLQPAFRLNKYLKQFHHEDFISDILGYNYDDYGNDYRKNPTNYYRFYNTLYNKNEAITWDDYVNLFFGKFDPHNNIIPFQKININYKFDLTDNYQIAQFEKFNPVLKIKNNINNNNFQNIHIYNNRPSAFLESNMFTIDENNTYKKYNINISANDQHDDFFNITTGILKHTFYGYSAQRYFKPYSYNQSGYRKTDYLYDSLTNSYDTSDVDFWGTPFNKSEQFIKQEKIFNNTKLTTYFLPMYAHSYYEDSYFRFPYFNVTAKDKKAIKENHPDHIIVRYFCRVDSD